VPQRREIRLPRFPECWETCGNCAQADIVVLTVHARPNDTLRADDPLITLETGKIALDIPSPYAGVVGAVYVEEGDCVSEGQLIAHIDSP
jgi:biotin carboxyl carrier protein